jgi:hypothetical protein
VRWRAALLVGILGVLVHLCVHNVVDNLYVQGMVLVVGLWLALAHAGRADGAKPNRWIEQVDRTESTGVLC